MVEGSASPVCLEYCLPSRGSSELFDEYFVFERKPVSCLKGNLFPVGRFSQRKVGSGGATSYIYLLPAGSLPLICDLSSLVKGSVMGRVIIATLAEG